VERNFWGGEKKFYCGGSLPRHLDERDGGEKIGRNDACRGGGRRELRTEKAPRKKGYDCSSSAKKDSPLALERGASLRKEEARCHGVQEG